MFVGLRLIPHQRGSSTRFLNCIPKDYHFTLPDPGSRGSPTYASELSKTRRLETERRHARERHDRILYEVLELENHMGITKRWTPATREYTETVRYIAERRYHQALNRLQRLVTQRLFELHRLNLSGIGQFSPLCDSPILTFRQVTKLALTLRSPYRHAANLFGVPQRRIIALHRFSSLPAHWHHLIGHKFPDTVSLRSSVSCGTPNATLARFHGQTQSFVKQSRSSSVSAVHMKRLNAATSRFDASSLQFTRRPDDIPKSSRHLQSKGTPSSASLTNIVYAASV